MSDKETVPVEAAPRSGYAQYVVITMFVVYTFNFVDRQIVAVMQDPIKAHFGLADWQLGLMTGTAFAIFYTFLGLPIAFLADRWNRVKIISMALVIWSAFTALFGLMQTFIGLLLMRIGVGIGEAGCSPPAHSLISDYVPPRKRSGALALYSLGIPVGSVLGILGGALGYRWVADWYAENGAPTWLAAIGAEEAWRAPFLLVGIPGILLGLLVFLTVREPKRGGLDQKPENNDGEKRPGLGEVFAKLSKKTSFWFIALGAAIASLVGYGLFPWLLSYFVRLYANDMALADAVAAAAVPYSFVVGGGGFVGTLLGGYLTDKFSGKSLGAYVAIPGVALLISLPIYFVALSIPPNWTAFLLLAISSALSSMWYGPVWATAQNLVAPGMRALTSAVLLFVINIIGLGLGPLAIGALSDFLRESYGDQALRYAIFIISSLTVPAALCFLFAGRFVKRDWEAGAGG